MDITSAFECATLAEQVRAAVMRHDPNFRGTIDTFITKTAGILANIVGPIPEDQWQDILRESERPCGCANCDCHIATASVFRGLDDLRTQFIAQTSKHG